MDTLPRCHSPCRLHQLLLGVLLVYTSVTPLCVTAATVKIISHFFNNESNLIYNGRDSERARDYMDTLLADHAATRSQLTKNFTKRSNVAVVYTCYERMEMIQKSLPAIFRSRGIENFDVFISQDGITSSIFDDETFSIPSTMRYVYIHHPANLCTGLHMHFVKKFAFDIMGYDILLIVEEDNVVHPQALQLLARMAELSATEPDVGVVSIIDMDMSFFVDSSRFSVGLIPVRPTTGHLWVYGLHRVKYDAIRDSMNAYYNAIKGYDYRAKHKPPLRDRIEALLQQLGFPPNSPLSQDRFFLNALARANYVKRYQTLFRFFEPIGSYGLHFRHNNSYFLGMFGRNMYAGAIDPKGAFDVTKEPRNVETMRNDVRERLSSLYMKHRNSLPSEELVNSTFQGIMAGRLQGHNVVQNIRGRPAEPPQDTVLCTTAVGTGASGARNLLRG